MPIRLNVQSYNNLVTSVYDMKIKTKDEYYEMRLYKCFGLIVKVKRTKHLLIHLGRNFVI